MKVCFLACHLPYPPVSGGRKREFELLRRLGNEYDVTVVAVSKTYTQDCANADRLRPYCEDVIVVPAQPGNHDAAIVARHNAVGVREIIDGLDVDVIHVEGFYLMQHVPDRSAPVLLVEQNIEYSLWEQRGDPVEARFVRRAEQASWERADHLGALTEEDMVVLRASGKPVSLVPDGVDRVEPARPSRGGTVLFFGNFAYEPNMIAAEYLLDEVMPRVWRKVSAAVQLVGWDPPERLLARRSECVSVCGNVPSVVPFIEAATVVVCPLVVGGGVKVKTLEALSRGKAIVTTPIGAQGLREVADGMWVTDGADEFAIATRTLLRSPSFRHSLERRAASAARTLPTWDAAADAVRAVYKTLQVP